MCFTCTNIVHMYSRCVVIAVDIDIMGLNEPHETPIQLGAVDRPNA